MAAAVVVLVITRADTQLSSIDGMPYNALSIGLALVAVAILLVACSHVLVLWDSFHGFLACLKTLPMARYFFPTDKSGGNRPVWVKQLNSQSIAIHAHVLNVLRQIGDSQPVTLDSQRWKEWTSSYSTCLQQRLSAGTRVKAQKNRQCMRKLSKTIAVEAFKIVQDHWPPDPLAGHVLDTESLSEDGGAGKQPPSEKSKPPQIEDLANAFLALHYSPYLLYCVRQIRNLIVFLSVGFLLLVMCLSSYSRQSPQFIGRSLIALFLVIGVVVLRSIIGMERDPILSRIAGTTPGKLGVESYLKIVGFAALPVLGLLASQFPSISNFLYSWVAPTLQALH